MRNSLDKSSVAQILDGNRLKGSLHFPEAIFSRSDAFATGRNETQLSHVSRGCVPCSFKLFGVAVGYLVKQRDAVGLGPQPHLAGIGERGILDFEQLFAFERHAEARASKVNT